MVLLLLRTQKRCHLTRTRAA